MKKVIAIILIAILCLFTVTAARESNVVKECKKECGKEKLEKMKQCRFDSQEQKKICDSDYKQCMIKGSLSFDRNEQRKSYRKCIQNKSQCIEIAEDARRDCLKEAEQQKEECNLTCDLHQECSTEYNPVCGTDGKTYANNCILNQAGIIKSHNGECDNGSCLVDMQCKADYSYCNCEWTCVTQIGENDCDRWCGEDLGPEPTCGCNKGKCLIR